MQMRCPNCGTENADTGSKFCQKCGTPLTPEAQMQMGQPMGAPQAKKKMSTTTIVVLVVVAIVVVIIVAGIWIAVSSFNRVTHGDVDMSVTNVSYSANESGITPSSGDRFALLTVRITNNGDLPVITGPTYFTVKAGGIDYGADLRFASDYTGTILMGSTQSFVVTFEIPSGATPTKLTFNGIFGSATCNVPA